MNEISMEFLMIEVVRARAHAKYLRKELYDLPENHKLYTASKEVERMLGTLEQAVDRVIGCNIDEKEMNDGR